MTPEEVCEIIGGENGETQIINHNEKEITISRPCPARWKCLRCGNVYNEIAMPRFCDCRAKQFELSYKDERDLIEFYLFNQDYFAAQMQSMVLAEQKAMLTELLTKVVKQLNPFYTTRHDEQPEVWTYEKGIYVPNGKTFIKEFCRNTLGQHYNIYLANQVIGKVETDTFIDSQVFFSNNIVEELPCENGLLNLKTKELLPFNEKKIHFIKVPIKFDSKATCPKIDEFLNGLLPSQEDVLTVYELIGYCLWKTYKLEKAAVCLGEGSNGKDTLLELIKRFLGAENTKAITLGSLEADDYAESELHLKLANLAGELSKKAISDDTKFKALTGRSELSANRKFKERITFVSFAKQIFAANYLPKVNDTTDGFWRRWVYLQFPYKFETQENIDLAKSKGVDVSKWKLKNPEVLDLVCVPEELSGLLNKAMEAINAVWERKAFTSSKSSEDTSTFWIRKSDSFLAFALENLVQAPDGYVLKETVRKVYQRYCKTNKANSESDKHISHIMQTQFGAVDSRKLVNGLQEHVWEGVQVKDTII